MLEDLVKESSFKWLNRTRSSFDKDLEEMEKSQASAGGMDCLPELSRYAKVVTWRCSKILGISMSELRGNFDKEASDSLRHPSHYARNFLEYCCFKALALSVNVNEYLGDRSFRCLTFDMMVAWEFPTADVSQASSSTEDATVGVEAFSRIASAVPIIANVIVSDNIFSVLTSSTDHRLHFSVYDKYLTGMERAIKKLKSQSESSHLSSLRSGRGEKILELDGTVTTQPVLEHVGISTWPGRLTLTDHALYFEALRVVSYDKAKVYDLSQDLSQVVKPELTGPWGTRLFDKAVFYKSTSLQEPVVMEFPELKGHTRRDYWLAIIREILYVHRFIMKFQITGVEREEAVLKAIFGILRVQALKDISSTSTDHICYEDLLMFNVCDQLPGGDLILETLANRSIAKELERSNSPKSSRVVHSISALTMASSLGFVFGSASSNETGISVGEIAVGEVTPLERAVKESRANHKKLVSAQATVDGVKVDGIDTNLAVMKELLSPVTQLGNWLLSLAHWEDPLRSMIFCLAVTYIINRGWLGYASAALLAFFAVFMLLTRYFSQGRGAADELKVTAPPEMNTVEQLLAVQNAISQAEELIQDGNIVLLKFRALLLSIFPQATEKFAGGVLVAAAVLAFVPCRYMGVMLFLEYFTRYSPLRKTSTERWTRRMREWWFSIPAAPVTLQRSSKEDKKRR
ncbi:unnamed protein product [Cuscuta campestris]|uniref:Uncharacterized protein n=1 Tax=Cuscuta campestris TaxID=132261 RepID=A0A484MEZ5_9ASTE|nr:unnamed protein product [Cuscuta campestris]